MRFAGLGAVEVSGAGAIEEAVSVAVVGGVDAMEGVRDGVESVVISELEEDAELAAREAAYVASASSI